MKVDLDEMTLLEIEQRAVLWPDWPDEAPNISAADAARGILRGDRFYEGVDVRAVLRGLLEEYDRADASRNDVPLILNELRRLRVVLGGIKESEIGRGHAYRCGGEDQDPGSPDEMRACTCGYVAVRGA